MDRKGCKEMITYALQIAEAVAQYGASAVSDVIIKMGNSHEAAALIDIEAAVTLVRMAKFETDDEKTFREKQ